MRRWIRELAIHAALLSGLVFVVPSPASGCVYLDFDSDDDPWTVESYFPGTSAEYTIIIESDGSNRFFDVGFFVSCCEWGQDRYLGASMHESDVVFNEEYVDRWEPWDITEPRGGWGYCFAFGYLVFLRDDVTFEAGQRYVIATGQAEAVCEDRPCFVNSNGFVLETGVQGCQSSNRMYFDCDTTSGLCCLPGGPCEDLTATECEEREGTFRDEVSCEYGIECPPTGACCLPDGDCVQLWEGHCIEAGGDPRGLGSLCGDGELCSTSSVSGLPDERHGIQLAAPFPNPSSGNIDLRFWLPRSGRTHVSIHDVEGREVVSAIDAWLDAGWHEISLADYPRPVLEVGVHFVRLSFEGESASQKIVIDQ